MSAAESTKAAASTRNGWLLSAPALVILTFAAVGPLLIVVMVALLFYVRATNRGAEKG